MNQRSSWGRFVLMIVLCLPFVYPFVFLAGTATKTRQNYLDDPLGLPVELTGEHIRYAWENASLGTAALNSLLAVGLSVVILVPLSAAAAFYFLRHPGRGSRSLMLVLFAFWAVPFIVYAVPLYVGLARTGVLNNLLVLGVVYAALNLPFGIYLMHSYYLRGIPHEVLEAASVDGASVWRSLWSIAIPLGRPALGTLAALCFVWCWGDLIVAAFLIQQTDRATLTLAASTLVSRQDNNIQQSAAAALISMLPVLLIFLSAQRAISRGIVAGSGK